MSWKRYSRNHLSSGKCKPKQLWDPTPHLLEHPKPRTRTAPPAGEDEESRLSHHCCWGCRRARPGEKAVWQFLIKLNTLSPNNPVISLHDVYPHKLGKRVSTQKPAHKRLEQPSSLSPNLGSNQGALQALGEEISWGPSRQWNLSSAKKKQVTKPRKDMETEMHTTEWQKPI